MRDGRHGRQLDQARGTAARAAPPPWHTLSSQAVLDRLDVRPEEGLSPAQVRERRARYGPNAIAEGPRRGVLRLVGEQFADVMVLLLVAAAIVAGVVGEAQDVITILAIVVLNAVLGFVQDYRAERAVAALRALAAPHASVRRGGAASEVPASELVPGDIVLLDAGRIVPADLRLVEVAHLRVEEAALTGESNPAEKRTEAVRAHDVPLGDRVDMAYKGTVATYGRGTGVVVATGMETELGRVAALVQGAGEGRTPLQRRLAHFARRLAVGILAVCGLLFAVGLLRGEPPVLMFLTALSLAVAAVPEALPAVVTVSLALGARRMVARNALVRRLAAVETLGSVTVICADKTGTLTANRMAVARVVDHGAAQAAPGSDDGGPPPLLLAVALSNDAEPDANGGVRGDPTEVALYEAAHDAGYDKREMERTLPRIGEIPFSSERGRMTTLHRRGRGVLALTKGAPELVLPRCAHRLAAGRVAPLDRDAVDLEAEGMAADGLRVLAVASRALPDAAGDLDPDAVERDLVLLGLVGLQDPPRPEAAKAVALCRSAGITVVMITGDHPATAMAIAREVGILPGESSDAAHVLTGRELGRLEPAALAERAGTTRVYARVAPEQKLDIVRALQQRGELVAMTGDGVNDAPALRRADIGVAMGRAGTDVAREAAHMVLLDDDFATIVDAVREGRRIYDNIRKFIRYVLTCNAAEIWTLLLAPFLALPLPLLPIHILWVNLVTDGLPGLALATEPEERDVMRRPPRPPNEGIFAHGLWQHMLWVGLLMAGVTLLVQGWAWRTGDAHWQSMTFTVLTLSQLGHVMAIRTERDSLFTVGPRSNPALLGTVVLTVLLQLATLYVPALARIFHTQPLSAPELAVCLLASTVVFAAVETEKWMRRRGWLYGEAADARA